MPVCYPTIVSVALMSDITGDTISRELGTLLGINPLELDAMRWLVEECRKQLEVNDWLCELSALDTHSPKLRISHRFTGEKRKSHEVIDLFKDIAEHIQPRPTPNIISKPLHETLVAFSKLHSCITSGQLAKLVSYTLRTLNINQREEYYVISFAFNEMRKFIGPGSLTYRESSFLDGISRMRGAFLRECTNNSISLCNKCGDRLSSCMCFHCGDFFCDECHQSVHMRGARRNHHRTLFEQQRCSECSERLGIVWCCDCGDLFCDSCFVRIHRTAQRTQHELELPYACPCAQCNQRPSTGLCPVCLITMCESCGVQHASRSTGHEWHSGISVRNFDVFQSIFQKAFWTSSSVMARLGYVEVTIDSEYYDFVDRVLISELPRGEEREDLHAQAVRAMLKRTQILKASMSC